MVVDVTDIPEARMGDEAVLLGGEGGDSFFGAAQKTGTINYELAVSYTHLDVYKRQVQGVRRGREPYAHHQGCDVRHAEIRFFKELFARL